MSTSGESRSAWQSVRQLPERTPLRVKLITAVLTLVAIALVVISIAGLGFLRTYLLNQADSNLNSAATNQPLINSSFRTYLATGQPAQLVGGAICWIPNGGKVHVSGL